MKKLVLILCAAVSMNAFGMDAPKISAVDNFGTIKHFKEEEGKLSLQSIEATITNATMAGFESCKVVKDKVSNIFYASILVNYKTKVGFLWVKITNPQKVILPDLPDGDYSWRPPKQRTEEQIKKLINAINNYEKFQQKLKEEKEYKDIRIKTGGSEEEEVPK